MQIYTNNKTNSEAVSKALFLGLTPKSLPAGRHGRQAPGGTS